MDPGLCNPQKGETTLEITELPVRKWTQDYKEFLEGLVRPEGKDEVGGLLMVSNKPI